MAVDAAPCLDDAVYAIAIQVSVNLCWIDPARGHGEDPLIATPFLSQSVAA
jgi:hypothetical protein